MIKLTPTVDGIKNFTRVQLGTLQIYFSYETPVALHYEGGWVVAQNQWGTTTGRHLNTLDSLAKNRVPHEEFLESLADAAAAASKDLQRVSS